MSYDLDKVNALLDAVRAMRSEIKKGKKAADSCKRQESANSCFRQADIHAHEAHCLCVELGIAAPEEWRYGEKTIGMKMGRNLSVNFRRPEGV